MSLIRYLAKWLWKVFLIITMGLVWLGLSPAWMMAHMLERLFPSSDAPPPVFPGISRSVSEVDYKRDIPTRLTLKKQLRRLQTLRQNKKP